MQLLLERMDNPEMFHTSVLVGDELGEIAAAGRMHPEPRNGYGSILSYLQDGKCLDVLILYGARNTGKRILMSQAIADMSQEDRDHTAFIQIKEGNVIGDLSHDLTVLRDHGIKYVFIDDVTLMPNFIKNASVLGNFFSYSMKIVISGSDNLGLMFAHKESLFSRSILLHTNYWPFPEWSRIAGSDDLDRYLERGGYYPGKDVSVASALNIAQDIGRYIVNYRVIGNLSKLENLWMKGELTYTIRIMLEDMTLDFLEGVGDGEFRERLDIFRKSRDEYHIGTTVWKALEVDLAEIDIIRYVTIDDVMYPEMKSSREILFIQPGLRYSLVMDIIDRIGVDSVDIIKNDVKHRILAETVLLSAIRNIESRWYHVFKLEGIDMVIWNAFKDEVYLFNVAKDFVDDALMEHIESHYGKIIGQYVIVDDSSPVADGVVHLKAENLLMKLEALEIIEPELEFIID